MIQVEEDRRERIDGGRSSSGPLMVAGHAASIPVDLAREDLERGLGKVEGMVKQLCASGIEAGAAGVTGIDDEAEVCSARAQPSSTGKKGGEGTLRFHARDKDGTRQSMFACDGRRVALPAAQSPSWVRTANRTKLCYRFPKTGG